MSERDYYYEMDSVSINEAIAISGFTEEVIDWIWTEDRGGAKPSLIIK